MYAAKRPRLQPVILVLIVASIFLAACGAQLADQNWPGLSASSDVVYVAYGQGVVAANISERRPLWSFPEEETSGLNFFAAPSISDEQIVLGDYGQSGGFFSPVATVTVYALENNTSSGEQPAQIWARDDVAGDRIIASPTQTATQVFVGTADNSLLALSASNGEKQWEFETGHSIWAKPLYHEGVVYVASLDNILYALRADRGEEMWRAELGGSIASSPTLADGVLYVPSFDRMIHALDADSGDELWNAPAEDWVWGSPAVGDGSVYYGDVAGNFYAVDAQTGEALWSRSVQGAIQSSPLYVDGVLYVVSGDIEGEEEEREGQVLALNAEDGSEVWRRPTPAPVFTSPVRIGDSLVVAFLDEAVLQLLVYELDTGDLTWEYSPPSE